MKNNSKKVILLHYQCVQIQVLASWTLCTAAERNPRRNTGKSQKHLTGTMIFPKLLLLPKTDSCRTQDPILRCQALRFIRPTSNLTNLPTICTTKTIPSLENNITEHTPQNVFVKNKLVEEGEESLICQSVCEGAYLSFQTSENQCQWLATHIAAERSRCNVIVVRNCLE